MFCKQLQLVCTLLALPLITMVFSQAGVTATENGIISATGGPQATQSVSYSIIDGGLLEPTASQTTFKTATPSSTSTDASVLSGTETNISSSKEHSLTTPAILGIVIAVVAAMVAIILFAIFMHKRKKQDLSRAKRKSIMDAEFAPEKSHLHHFDPPMSSLDKSQTQQLGYFDLAKPLPVVIEQNSPEADPGVGLSRSSTLIADAAEIAQMNRKKSLHGKKSREQQRERHQALHILITNEDNRTVSLTDSPLSSFPVTPREAHYSMTGGKCHDGDGDPFAKRPSKI